MSFVRDREGRAMFTADIQVVEGQDYSLTRKSPESPAARVLAEVVQRVARTVDVTSFTDHHLHLLVAVSLDRSFCNRSIDG